MDWKNFWAKIKNWFNADGMKENDYYPSLDKQGLMNINDEAPVVTQQGRAEPKGVIVKTIHSTDKTQSLEKLQEGFNTLLDQLKNINEQLGQQVVQHDNLMKHLEMMPKLLESFPDIITNQGRFTEQMLENLKVTTAKTQCFIDAVEKIPAETARQTSTLSSIDHQLAAAADADAQMAETFNKFSATLEKMDRSLGSQTEGIAQMTKTFAASDRYLKYLITRQNKRFMWIFITAVAVCIFVIFTFAGIIVYLRR